MVRADLLNPMRRAEDCPPYQFSSATDEWPRLQRKAPAKYFTGACSFYLETYLSLRPCRSRSSRFLAFNDSRRLRRLRQYYFAHDYPIAHC
jgi:hypothetical protein